MSARHTSGNQDTCAPSELQVALSCLAHPWSLAALAILGLNDHLWKGAGPGWLTGKLSDFAGLFFFPFLVSALLAVVAGRRRSTGATAFAVVALWFATAKTLVPVHAATVALAAFLFGPVEVVRDPTDLIALVALLPAWRLRRRIATEAPTSFTRLVQTPALCAALLLTSATSRPKQASVEELIEHQGEVYAVVRHHSEQSYYPTRDGIHWRDSASLAADVVEAHQPRTELTTVEPSPQRYRLDGQRVLRLDDGRWQVAWRIPEGRGPFMATFEDQHWQASDIATLPSGAVVVALGSEGVVTRSEDGTWKRVGVDAARPTPMQAKLLEVPWRLVEAHWIRGAAATISVFFIASMLLWFVRPRSSFPTADTHQPRPSRWRRLRSAASALWARTEWNGDLVARSIVMLVFILVCAGNLFWAAHYLGPSPLDFFFALMILPFFSASAFVTFGGWRHFRREHPDERVSFRRLAAGAISGGLAALAIVACWDLGWITSLSTANLLGASAVVAIAAAAAHGARREPH